MHAPSPALCASCGHLGDDIVRCHSRGRDHAEAALACDCCGQGGSRDSTHPRLLQWHAAADEADERLRPFHMDTLPESTRQSRRSLERDARVGQTVDADRPASLDDCFQVVSRVPDVDVHRRGHDLVTMPERYEGARRKSPRTVIASSVPA